MMVVTHSQLIIPAFVSSILGAMLLDITCVYLVGHFGHKIKNIDLEFNGIHIVKS